MYATKYPVPFYTVVPYDARSYIVYNCNCDSTKIIVTIYKL